MERVHVFGLSEKQKRGKQAIRGWCALLCAGGLLFLLAYMDDRCVDRAPHAGFCPPEATWRTYCADAPRFWRTLQHAPAGQITVHSIPRRLHEAALAIRLQTGIRPTPSRMRIWLGRQCLIGGQGPHWGGCTYPGLLLRTFSKAHAFLAGPVIASESIYRFRHCYYAWREGYLLFSPHLSYIQQALAAPPVSKEAAGKHEMVLTWTGPAAGTLHISPATLQVSGEIQCNAPLIRKPLSIAEGWSEDALCVVGVADWTVFLQGLILALQSSLVQQLGGEYALNVWRTWGLAWPDLGRSVEEIAIGLASVDMKNNLPEPVGALVMRAEKTATAETHPFAPMLDSMDAIPYAWEAWEGRLAPFLGDAFTLCTAQREDRWLLTSRQSLMYDMLMMPPAPTPSSETIFIRVNWAALSRLGKQGLSWAAKRELLSGYTVREAMDTWTPVLNWMAQWGQMVLRGYGEGKRLHFRGTLVSIAQGAA